MSRVLSQLETMAAQSPMRVAIEFPGGAMNYGALWKEVCDLAATIGDMASKAVGIELPDGPAWIVAHLACVRAHIPQVPIPPFFTAMQREHALRDAGADLLLYTDSRADNPAIRLMHQPLRPVMLPAQTSMVTYTSGSTGTPKGVCLSQSGMECVAQSLLDVLGTEVAQRHLSVLPLSVLLEQVGGLYTCLLAGGTYIFSKQPLADGLRDSSATSCILVPELLKQLVADCETVPRRFPHVRFMAVGGARVAEPLLRRAEALGLPVYEGYGLTESASVVAVNTPAAHKKGTVGKPLPHIQFRLKPDGEIELRHPAMLGYAGEPALAAEEYATGDLGSIDADGYLTLRGRKKTVLITAYGRNVAPEWPESLLLEQPEIRQALVYGDSDAMLSALIVADATTGDAAIERAITRANAHLPDYARIASWQRIAPFTVANGMLTGNGRIRRDTILFHHVQETAHDVLRSARA